MLIVERARRPTGCSGATRRRRSRGRPTVRAGAWCALPRPRSAAIHPSHDRASERVCVLVAEQPGGLGRVHTQQQAAPAAHGHGHVAVDQEGEAAERALLGDAVLHQDKLSDPVREILVVGHSPIIGACVAAPAQPSITLCTFATIGVPESASSAPKIGIRVAPNASNAACDSQMSKTLISPSVSRAMWWVRPSGAPAPAASS